MPGLRSDVDPDGLLEYSVVYTDRALNHMSSSFQQVMNDLSAGLRRCYGAEAAVVVPGSGTFAMEAVARQLAPGRTVLILRNGWFSYRWTQILEAGAIADKEIVLKARRAQPGPKEPFAPAPIDEVVATIAEHQPSVVFAPHVETSAGMILPDDYLRAVADAVHGFGGLFVLDCIASGTAWVDMAATGVDVLLSAPQKGWSSSPCCGLVMLSAAAREAVESSTSSSFACDLGRWLQIMDTYTSGGHAYHATMPTDGLAQFRTAMAEAEQLGFDHLAKQQWELGRRVRATLADRGVVSVAADGYGAPGVVVAYADHPDLANGSRFAASGLQIAAGVPLQCDEGDDFSTFRLGLFGLDKLTNVDRTVATLDQALDAVLA